MALTVANLHTALAYRLGESSSPSDSTTKAQRLEWFNQGYFNIARRRNWWWLEGTNTSNTNTGSTTGYAEPSDLKSWIELKIGSIYYDQIPYRQNQIYQSTGAVVTLPTLRQQYRFYIFGGRYYLLPTDGAGGETHTIKYWKRVSKNTLDADTWLIPDEYLECLVAYAEFRYWMSITQQSKAQAPGQEYEEIVKDMEREQGRRGTGFKEFTSILDPEDAYF